MLMIALVFIIWTTGLRADTIFLKNGTTIEGEIKDFHNKTVIIKIKDGSRKHIGIRQIKTIEATDISPGKEAIIDMIDETLSEYKNKQRVLRKKERAIASMTKKKYIPYEDRLRNTKGPNRVLFFMRPDNSDSIHMRNFLKNSGIPYIEYDITSNISAQNKFRYYKGRQVPMVVVNGQVIVGYNPSEVARVYGNK